MSVLIVALAALAAGRLGRRLCGDAFAATSAALVYGLSPTIEVLARADARTAGWTVLLPILLICFYRSNESVESGFRAALPSGGVLALCGTLDPRVAIASGILIGSLLLAGYLMDRQKSSAVWNPAFGRWLMASGIGVALYSPLWLWRTRHPVALPLEFSYEAINAARLLHPSPHYLGFAACALAVAAVTLSRSYRGPARLWGWIAATMIWLSLGPDFRFGGRTFPWVPCLYLGASKLPWVRDVPPILFAACGKLSLGILSAFGLLALSTRLPARHLLWTKIALTAATAAILCADYLRA